MSIENVKAFYEKLAIDEAFRVQINSSQSKQECIQIIQSAGFNFTQEEFEDFTGNLLDEITDNQALGELKEKELELAIGGTTSSILGFKYLSIQPKYGSVRPVE